MGIILFFIDAENVSKSQVENAYIDMKSNLESGDILIGKFYGQKETLGNLVEHYLNYGFDFVDTGVYSTNKKNVTDMKIMVDSIMDMFVLYQRDVKAVYILSNDCDFNPLIHKFKSFNVKLVAATFDSFGDLSTVDDFAKLLHFRGYLPISKENVLGTYYEELVELTKDLFLDDSNIMEYLRYRITHLQRALRTTFKLDWGEMSDDAIRHFSFSMFDKFMCENGQTDSTENLVFFTTRFFGGTLNRKDVKAVLEERSV